MSLLYRLLGIDGAGDILRAAAWSLEADRPLPWWGLALFAALGLAAAGLNFLPQNVMTWRSRIVLALLRLGGFALLLVMLLQLELRLRVETRLRPRVALLADASGSMDVRDAAGGATRREAAARAAAGLVPALDGRVELSRYAFAWRIEPGDAVRPAAGATRLAASLEEVLRRERDLDAVLLLTDGNDTGGDRAVAQAQLLAARGVRVFPVVFGEAGAPPRAEVRIAAGAPYVRLGDECLITASLAGTGLAEQRVRAALYEQGADAPLAVRENVPLGARAGSVSFVVKPTRAGERIYRVALEGVKGGVSDRRLAAEHRVEVVDARIRVLYLDIARDERKLLGHWLARDPVVDLATLTLLPKGGWYGQGALRHKDVNEGLPGSEADLYQYDVIVLGDIPRSYFRQGGDAAETRLRWLVEFAARRGGGLVTLGGRSVYAAGGYQDSELAAVLPFDLAAAGDPQAPKPFALVPTALGLVHPVMQIEGDAQANRDAWIDLPPLDGCNRVGAARPGAAVLAVRQGEGGSMPVLAVQDVGKGKVLALAADTTWRWQMMREAEAPDHYRRFWGNVVRYLAPDPRLQPGRPQTQRRASRPAVGETCTLATRLVDKLYQPVRGADLTVTVASPSGRLLTIFPRDSRGKPGVYEYDVTLSEPGDWVVRAATRDQTAEETLRAGESDEEMDDPRARPDRMAELAAATGGRVFRPTEVAEAAAAVAARHRTAERTHVVPLWNLPLLLALVLGIVCLDCWIRKRKGMC